MKKFFLLSIIAMSINVYAQTKKGDKLLGVSFGSISYTNSNSETSYSNTATIYKSDGNSFSISVNPTVSWFVQDNLAIGGGISLSYYISNSNSSNTGSTTTTDNKYNQPSVYISPQIRYYFGDNDNGMPFAQLNAQYGISGGSSESKTSTGSSSKTTTKPKGDWNAGVSLGYEHFITHNVGFYGMVGFNYGKSKTLYEYRPSTGTGYDYTSKYGRFYIPFNLGLQVHL